jgi:hypothetical protein
MRRNGIANWALSLGRQRMGKLTLQNHRLISALCWLVRRKHCLIINYLTGCQVTTCQARLYDMSRQGNLNRAIGDFLNGFIA